MTSANDSRVDPSLVRFDRGERVYLFVRQMITQPLITSVLAAIFREKKISKQKKKKKEDDCALKMGGQGDSDQNALAPPDMWYALAFMSALGTSSCDSNRSSSIFDTIESIASCQLSAASCQLMR